MMTTLSEAYKEHPLNPEHIIPIDFQSIHKVPNSHLWPNINENTPQINPKTSEYYEKQPLTIPIIDFSAPNVVELLGEAFETWGVFHIINHGVEETLIDEVEAETYRLFALPASCKIKALRSPGGATGYGAARISPFFPKMMWHEGFTIIGSPVDHARELWPNDYQHFCDTMEKYQKKMKTLAFKLMQLILNSITPATSPSPATYSGDSSGALKLNSYPCCPNPSHALGLAPHTDSLFLTILHQSNTNTPNGLQVFKHGLGWAPVHRVSGGLVVIVGDLLHVLSNAKFPAVYHRAVVNRAVHRVSMAYFYGPPVDSAVAPVVFRDGSPVVYRTVKVKDYLSLKAVHLEKALSFIRL